MWLFGLISLISTTEDAIPQVELLDEVFSRFVNENGEVNYDALRENPVNLKNFVEFLKKVSPVNHPERFPTNNDAKAYWINAYNALVMISIVENPEIESVKDLGWGMGLFWRKTFLIGGRRMTLNQIERKILRDVFADPRMHFAINCGSNSCPPLGQRIFSGEDLDQQLDEKARQFINNPENVVIDRDEKIVWLSRIFKWYSEDFEAVSEDVLHYIFQYLEGYSETEIEKIVNSYQVRYFTYDWSLNSTNGQ
ncbi:MAG: DUF547 domain-containing protein [Fidelibacterota bacterium]